jgi:arylsulfatase A-like enzyme
MKNSVTVLFAGFLVGLVAVACSSPAVVAAETAAAKRPNVLFLFTDDQRADTVAALGNPHILTPNLDRLVQSGLVFHNTYCMGSTMPAVCLPSRTMMLSGRSLFHIENRGEEAASFPKSMSGAGYFTYHHGKRSNTPHDIHRAFDQSRYLKDREVRESGYPGKEVADRAVAFLQNYDEERPFFMYLAFAGPHDPRQANAEYLAKYNVGSMLLPANYLPLHPFDNGEMTVRDERLAPWPRAEQVVREHLRDYYAVITHMDAQIGRVLNTLEEIGEYENTLIVFSSDHGLAVGSHGLMGKQNLYEHSMRVPLVFSGPGIPQGKSASAFAYLFDIFPTVCDLVGTDVPTEIDGVSFAPVIRGSSSTGRETIYTAYREVQRGVRRGRWKLLRYPKINRSQLFDLEADPHEQNDLSENPGQRERVVAMSALLEQQRQANSDKTPLMTLTPKDAAFRPPAE